MPDLLSGSEGLFVPFDPDGPFEAAERHLPHWCQEGRTYFATFRLADAIPQHVLLAWRDEFRRWTAAHPKPWSGEQFREYGRLFPERFHSWLDAGHGSCILRQPAASLVVANALLYFDRQRYVLDHYVVMPNHVHVVFLPSPGQSLRNILHSWKSFTANEINRLANRSGAFWQAESYDHLVRSEGQLEHYRQYISENPGKAKLREGEFRYQAKFGVLPPK
jgi:hypothetical protein